MSKNKNKNKILPLIAMKGLVVFPEMVINFDVTNPKFVEALKTASLTDKTVFLVTQKNTDEEYAGNGVFDVGVIAEVRQILRTPDKITRVLVQGLSRARIVSVSEFDRYDVAEVTPLIERKSTISEETEATYCRAIKILFSEYATLVPKMPEELIRAVEAENDLKKIFDIVIFNVFLRPEDKQLILETNGIVKRSKLLIDMLTSEIKILRFEVEIHEQIKSSIDNSQREFILREQMKAISRQLGGSDDGDEEIYEYCDKIQNIGFSEDVEEKLLREANKMFKLSPSSQERELFSTISRAVTSQPPSRDIKRLSWYEKILLYDPVLLEDLTKWLNEEGLGSVGYDGEVQPLQVRAWCLREGICCLWKESKRNRGVGGVKKIGRE